MVERHTRCVVIHDGGALRHYSVIPKHHTPSAAVSQDSNLRVSRKSFKSVQNQHSAQSYAADRAALEPLFGVAWLETN